MCALRPDAGSANPGDTVVILGAALSDFSTRSFTAPAARKDYRDRRVGVSPRYRIPLRRGCGHQQQAAEDRRGCRQLADLGADIVVDAVGNLLPQAVKLARRGGRIILFGLQMHALPPVSQYLITRHELTVYGVFVGINPFPQTVRLLESGVIRPSVLITHRMPVASVTDALTAMRAGETMKVIVEHQKEA